MDAGVRELTIVTADLTVKEGETVGVLPEGSVLSGTKIENKEFLGVLSEGMFLSLEELELEEKSQTIMRLEQANLESPSLSCWDSIRRLLKWS